MLDNLTEWGRFEYCYLLQLDIRERMGVLKMPCKVQSRLHSETHGKLACCSFNGSSISLSKNRLVQKVARQNPSKYVSSSPLIPRATAAPPTTASTAPSSGSQFNGFYDVVVVGAGISGLTTALALQAEHATTVKHILVTEGRDRVGGNITSLADNARGYLWEEGPNSFQPNDSMLKAAVDSNCDKDLVFGDPKAPRFVFWEGRLRPTPSGPDALNFDLMTIPGKIRAGLGALGLFKAPMPQQEESVEQFVKRNLGDEVFFRLIEPFCSGVYAGDPTKLSMKAAFGKVYDLEKKGGSIVGGVIKLLQDKKANPPPPRDARLPPKPQGQTVGSFKRGLQTLPIAIADKLGSDVIRTSWNLKSIVSSNEDASYSLIYDTPQGQQQVKTKCVALTVPSYIAADLVADKAAGAAEKLRSLDYPPVAAVTLSYPETAIRPDRLDAQGALPGFGQLHPRTQGITTLGTIYSSSLFPGRAPPGQTLLLNYFGGALNRKVTEMSDDDIIAQVDKDLRVMLLRPDAPPPKKIAVRVWPRAIPQFNVGHLEVVSDAEEEMKKSGLNGVLLGGNYVAGVALGKCVEYGYEFAKKAAAVVEKSSVV